MSQYKEGLDMTDDVKLIIQENMKLQIIALKKNLNNQNNFKRNERGHDRSIVQMKDGDENGNE